MPIFLPIDNLWTDMIYFNSCTWTDHVSHDYFFNSLNTIGVYYTPTLYQMRLCFRNLLFALNRGITNAHLFEFISNSRRCRFAWS